MKSRYLIRSYPLHAPTGRADRAAARAGWSSRRLPVVRGVIQKPGTSLPGDDVDYRALMLPNSADAPTDCTCTS